MTITHFWFPSLCLGSDLTWVNDKLICPHCGRMIAYRIPMRNKYDVYVCYRYRRFAAMIIASSPYAPPVAPKAELVFDRAVVAPLLSDYWKEDGDFTRCVAEFRDFVVRSANAYAVLTGLYSLDEYLNVAYRDFYNDLLGRLMKEKEVE